MTLRDYVKLEKSVKKHFINGKIVNDDELGSLSPYELSECLSDEELVEIIKVIDPFQNVYVHDMMEQLELVKEGKK